jgi:hypothetical protein
MHANIGETYNTTDTITRLAGLLTADAPASQFWQHVLEHGMETTRADVAGAYALQFPERRNSDLRLVQARGAFPMPEALSHRLEFVSFLRECGETIVLAKRRGGFFLDTLVHPAMQSSIVLPLRFESWEYGALVFNARSIGAFGAPRFHYLNQLAQIAGALLAVRRQQPAASVGREALARVQTSGSS